MFGTPDVEAIGNNSVPPDVVIESKALRTPLGDAVTQLESYVNADPRMRVGVAVLTNGSEWWIYDLSKGGAFSSKFVDQVNILTGSQRSHAQFLNRWLRRSGYRPV